MLCSCGSGLDRSVKWHSLRNDSQGPVAKFGKETKHAATLFLKMNQKEHPNGNNWQVHKAFLSTAPTAPLLTSVLYYRDTFSND